MSSEGANFMQTDADSIENNEQNANNNEYNSSNLGVLTLVQLVR